MTLEPRTITGRNFWLNVMDGVLFPAGNAFISPSTLLPLFVASMTASKLAIGVASALLMVGFALTQLVSAYLGTKARHFWRWFLVSNGTTRVTLLPLIFVPLAPMPYRLGLCFGGLLLFAIGWGLAAPSWGEFIGRLMPADRRGAFFGWRGTLQGPASMLATLGATLLLSRLRAPWSFVACFAVAFALISLSFLSMALTRVPWQAELDPEPQRTPFWSALPQKLAQNPHFVRYTLCRMVLACGAASTSFSVVAAEDRFGLSRSTSSLLGIALLALPTLSGIWWGRLSDRRGPRTLLLAAVTLGGVSNLLLAFSHALWLYVLGLLLVGMTANLLVMADACLYAICPGERATYFGLFAVCLLPATLGAPLLAGLLADRAGVGVVFACSAVAWALGGLVLPAWGPGVPRTAATSIELA